MKKHLIKTIFLIGAIFLFAACQQKPSATTATPETQQKNAPQETEAIGQKPSQSLSECKDEDCFYGLIPREQATSYTFDDCKNLDGKISDDVFETDLGMICRLVISRSQASFRKVDPCKNSDELNPDYEFHLNPEIGLQMYLVALQKQYLDKYGVGQGAYSFGNKGSTLYGSYHQSMDSYEKEGNKRHYNFDTYFCLTGEPVRYTPYFYSLEIYKDPNDPDTSEIKGMDYIETPPVLDPIIDQFDNNKDGIKKLKDEGFSLTGLDKMENSSLIADLNGDGANDLLLVFRKYVDSYYLPVLCLYDKNGNSCTLVEAKEFLSIPEKAKYSATTMITPLTGNKFKLQILDTSADNAVVAETTYQYADDELSPVKKVKRT